MKIDQQRQIKKHTHRLNYLKEEFIDVCASTDAGSREINLAVFEFFARSGKRIPLNQEAKQQDHKHESGSIDEENNAQDPDVKKIFRKIAIRTHPDKLDKDDPDYETLTQSYIAASKAAMINNFDELVQIAIDLEIPIDVDHEVQIRSIEKMAQKIEKQISDLKGAAAYIWSTASDVQVKKNLLKIIIQNLNENPDQQILDDIVVWITSNSSVETSYVSRDPNRPVSIDMRRPGTRPVKRMKRQNLNIKIARKIKIMNKEQLKEVSPLIDKIALQAQIFINDESLNCNNLLKEQEIVAPFANKITTLTRAFRTAAVGKNHDEIASLAAALTDKIDQTINVHLQEIKIKAIIANSKKDGFIDLKQKIIDTYNDTLGDAERIEEVVTLIETGNEPALGRKRKMGTRPEKLSVVRRAQDVVKQKQDEKSQESE